MINSMTGFGRGRAVVDGVTAIVEMRSVNRRFHEASVRIPRSLSAREAEVQARLRDAFERGRFTVNVQLEAEQEDPVGLRVDPKMARSYTRLLTELRTAAGLDAPVRLEHLLSFSDVFAPAESNEMAEEKAWPAVEAALEEAVDAMRAMRREEGRALADDLETRIEAIGEQLRAVEARAPERLEARREELKARLDELFADERLAADRLEAEVALLADKLDVTEECVRLRSHLDQFRQALASDAPAGRKLKFLVQEIHREVNTIGAKANDTGVAHRTVAMKEEIERIREQVQNVE